MSTELESELLPSWYYSKSELKKTPSALDGISYDTECRYRRESARFIIKIGLLMKLRYDTMATGVVYMHRFYMCHSFKTFSRFVTGCGCLFLAGKVEETPKKCKDIIKVAKSCMTDAQLTTFGEDPKETVMIMERILLQTINFNLQVDHPYNHMLRYAKESFGENQGEIEKIVQMAWTFINDSLCTTICLQYEPEIVAIAAMFLAGKLSKTRTGKEITERKWYDVYVESLSIDILEDICHQILDLYAMPTEATTEVKDSPTHQSNVINQQIVQGIEESKIPVLASDSNGMNQVTSAIPVLSNTSQVSRPTPVSMIPTIPPPPPPASDVLPPLPPSSLNGSLVSVPPPPPPPVSSDFGHFVDQNMYMFESNIGHSMPSVFPSSDPSFSSARGSHFSS